MGAVWRSHPSRCPAGLPADVCRLAVLLDLCGRACRLAVATSLFVRLSDDPRGLLGWLPAPVVGLRVLVGSWLLAWV